MISILSHKESPLMGLYPYFELQNDFSIVYDQSDISPQSKEIWLDAYVDLYDDANYSLEKSYPFFLKLHKLCQQFESQKVRVLRNFFYQTSHKKMKDLQSRYQHFFEILKEEFSMIMIFLPDVLIETYRSHPYQYLKKGEWAIPWDKNSLLRIIKESDLVANLSDKPLPNKDIIVAGQKTSLFDMNQKIQQIFGVQNYFASDYSLNIDEKIQGHVLSDLHYNFEAICISDLK